MKTVNPFINSNDNKRYFTWNYYLKCKFNSKVFKVPLNAGFTCPNRDGSKGTGGCSFCSSKGSGDYCFDSNSLLHQYNEGILMMQKKWDTNKTIPYFQSYTNTYGSLNKIKQCIEPFINKEEVVAIAIATRADCLSDECIEYLNSLTDKKEIWLELGLQTIHDKTAIFLNRCHTYKEFINCINKLVKTNLKICVHIMNSLPYETSEMMIQTAKEVGSLPIHAVKIHMLHLINGSKLANDYIINPFHLLSIEEYVDIVIKQLEYIPSNIIIQRLTGDGVKEDLVAPLWTLNKTNVLNNIDKRMYLSNTYQGIKCK